MSKSHEFSALANAATNGAWYTVSDGLRWAIAAGERLRVVETYENQHNGLGHGQAPGGIPYYHDAKFIAWCGTNRYLMEKALREYEERLAKNDGLIRNSQGDVVFHGGGRD